MDALSRLTRAEREIVELALTSCEVAGEARAFVDEGVPLSKQGVLRPEKRISLAGHLAERTLEFRGAGSKMRSCDVPFCGNLALARVQFGYLPRAFASKCIVLDPQSGQRLCKPNSLCASFIEHPTEFGGAGRKIGSGGIPFCRNLALARVQFGYLPRAFASKCIVFDPQRGQRLCKPNSLCPRLIEHPIEFGSAGSEIGSGGVPFCGNLALARAQFGYLPRAFASKCIVLDPQSGQRLCKPNSLCASFIEHPTEFGGAGRKIGSGGIPFCGNLALARVQFGYLPRAFASKCIVFDPQSGQRVCKPNSLCPRLIEHPIEFGSAGSEIGSGGVPFCGNLALARVQFGYLPRAFASKCIVFDPQSGQRVCKPNSLCPCLIEHPIEFGRAGSEIGSGGVPFCGNLALARAQFGYLPCAFARKCIVFDPQSGQRVCKPNPLCPRLIEHPIEFGSAGSEIGSGGVPFCGNLALARVQKVPLIVQGMRMGLQLLDLNLGTDQKSSKNVA